MLNLPPEATASPAPPLSILTRRGKHLQKAFTVFVRPLSDTARQGWTPTLDLNEHTDSKWWPVSEIRRQGLTSEGSQFHPIVLLAFGKHWPEIEAGVGGE